MINPTWQDRERLVLFVPNSFLDLPNPIQYANKSKYNLISWNANLITIKDDKESLTCEYKNLFWEDGNGDFNERKMIGLE